MSTFLSVALIVYGAMHLYMLGKAWLILPRSFGLALALLAAGLLLTLSPFLVSALERQGWQSIAAPAAWATYIWMGYLFLFFWIGLLLDLGHALAALLKFAWPLTAAASFHIAALLALALLGYGFVEARQIRVEEVSIATPKLAAGRVTIAQISDLHLGTMQGSRLVDSITAKLHELRPDIVVATGDIVEGHGGDLDALADRFRSYTPPLGAYAVIGNHERHAGLENALRFLRRAGYNVLRGESVKAGGIILTGVDDYWASRPGGKAPDSAANDFVVLLKHQPVVDNDVKFDLQLSGHIHGGQIFPFVYLTQLVHGARTGLTPLSDERQLYVSRGTGTWGPPIRVFAPPEIALITISSANR